VVRRPVSVWWREVVAASRMVSFPFFGEEGKEERLFCRARKGPFYLFGPNI
jgi:hypothetical protein